MPSLAHRVSEAVGEKDGAAAIEVDEPERVFDRLVMKLACAMDRTGIVDEQSDLEILGASRDSGIEVLCRQIGDQYAGFDAVARSQIRCEFLEERLSSREQDEIDSAFGELACKAFADSVRGAGDQRPRSVSLPK
jgi:hypothetical protein